MTELFGTSVPNINMHLKNCFAESEINQNSVIKDFLITASDGKKVNMGLTNWRGAKVRKNDVVIAKNYLNENELLLLNNLVEQYLIFAEGQAIQRVPMYMKDWIKKLEDFLKINNRKILQNKGKASHEQVKKLAEAEYEKFNQKRANEVNQIDTDFDAAIKLIEGE